MFDQPFWFFANFSDYERGLSAAMVVLSMLGMGATLTVRDFANTFVAWKGLAVGMAAQLVLVPLWAALIMYLLGSLPPGFGGLSMPGAVGIATGIALIAAMPGGSTSNLLTFLGNGNVALSVSLTAMTTFVCLFATPIVLATLIIVEVPGNFDIDTSQIMLDIGLFLIVPLLIGMVVRAHARARQQAQFTKVMVRASLALLALIIVGSLGAGRLHFAPYGWLGPLAITVFCVGSVQLARLAAFMCGLATADVLAIIVEVSLKNVMLALLVLTSMFPSEMPASEDGPGASLIAAARDGCIFVVLFFGGVALVTSSVSVWKRRKVLANEHEVST